MRLGEEQVVREIRTLSVTELRVWIDAGWVAPATGERGPVFDEVDVARVRLLCQLRDDVGLDEAAMPVVLSLMDQLYGVRRELRCLAQAVDQQPAETAAAIRAAYRAMAGGGR